ncbi:hypothetical protein [Staphylococcus pettenkoferi]|uniref:hypothetical protein n=1 Tax=Staphylococcus pettenkoferi TaxID=170573 RepID=UPI002272332A|nr:hypothetical protein [Staphylococcus pettenkoferi]MCY1573146.1 hypothetical protein [Staphylococcus pettenkoferi]MCY1579308.1 hypothetical protein [Staphylococcus pettenkoferi]
MKYLRIISFILFLFPLEFIGMMTDYQTGSTIGYITYLIAVFLISIALFNGKLKTWLSIFVSRVIGIFVSWICVQLFFDIYETAGYFKPFTANSFAIVLGIIQFILILLITFVIFAFFPRKTK